MRFDLRFANHWYVVDIVLLCVAINARNWNMAVFTAAVLMIVQVLWPYLLELLVIGDYSDSLGVLSLGCTNDCTGAVALPAGVIGDW